jgi:mono/diheme cytochrome c family protein
MKIYSGMKTLMTIAACMIMLAACENRRSNEGSTSKAPDEKTDRDRTDKDERESPIVDIKEKDRDKDGGLLEKDREVEERIDKSLANAGKSIFMAECASCHRVVDKDKDGIDNDSDKKYAGPELTEITDRRNDRWLVKFMTNTDGLDRSDKDPKDVCIVDRKGKELNRDQALKVLEYLHLRNVRDDVSN